MGEQVTGQEEEVGPWDRSRLVTRTYLGTVAAASAQSKAWIALWAAAGLAVVVVLAVTRAPQVAYLLTGAVLVVVVNAGVRSDRKPTDDE
jgi:hypothetical protein